MWALLLLEQIEHKIENESVTNKYCALSKSLNITPNSGTSSAITKFSSITSILKERQGEAWEKSTLPNCLCSPQGTCRPGSWLHNNTHFEKKINKYKRKKEKSLLINIFQLSFHKDSFKYILFPREAAWRNPKFLESNSYSLSKI